jgi:Uma2 family endonuclease
MRRPRIIRVSPPGEIPVSFQEVHEPQPDCLLFIQPGSGGQVRIDDEGSIEGAPDLLAEIAASSARYDLHAKLNAHCRNGVREYIVWRVDNHQIDWYVRRGGAYEPLAAGPDGILRSTVFPGLNLDSAALLRGDLSTVFADVQQGRNTPEHTDFVARLWRK